jgi:hypothetical protein
MVKTLLTLTDDWLFNSLYLLPPCFETLHKYVLQNYEQ